MFLCNPSLLPADLQPSVAIDSEFLVFDKVESQSMSSFFIWLFHSAQALETHPESDLSHHLLCEHHMAKPPSSLTQKVTIVFLLSCLCLPEVYCVKSNQSDHFMTLIWSCLSSANLTTAFHFQVKCMDYTVFMKDYTVLFDLTLPIPFTPTSLLLLCWLYSNSPSPTLASEHLHWQFISLEQFPQTVHLTSSLTSSGVCSNTISCLTKGLSLSLYIKQSSFHEYLVHHPALFFFRHFQQPYIYLSD